MRPCWSIWSRAMDDKIWPNDMYIETSTMNLLDENIDKFKLFTWWNFTMKEDKIVAKLINITTPIATIVKHANHVDDLEQLETKYYLDQLGNIVAT